MTLCGASRRSHTTSKNSILKDVAAVDAKFFDHGERNIPGWMSERARAIVVGVRRAGAKMADEVWATAAEEAPEFAHEAGTWARRLSARMVGRHRQRLVFGRGLATPAEAVEACKHLSEVLRKECGAIVADLQRRSVPLAPPVKLAGSNFNAASFIEVPPRAVQQAYRLDISALLTMLSEVRSAIQVSRIDAARRGMLTDQIAAIEAFAKRSGPHQGILLRMMRRLPPALKTARTRSGGELS